MVVLFCSRAPSGDLRLMVPSVSPCFRGAGDESQVCLLLLNVAKLSLVRTRCQHLKDGVNPVAHNRAGVPTAVSVPVDQPPYA